MTDDRFIWEKGDVQIYRNEAERDREMAKQGYTTFIEPGKRPRKLKEVEKEGK